MPTTNFHNHSVLERQIRQWQQQPKLEKRKILQKRQHHPERRIRLSNLVPTAPNVWSNRADHYHIKTGHSHLHTHDAIRAFRTRQPISYSLKVLGCETVVRLFSPKTRPNFAAVAWNRWKIVVMLRVIQRSSKLSAVEAVFSAST